MVNHGIHRCCCGTWQRTTIESFYIVNMKNLTPEQVCKQLGLQLPPAPTPLGVYKPCLVEGNYLYVSGHGPVLEDKRLIQGRVGETMDMEQGKLAARQVGLAILS